ncbi:hypothetical protein T03_2325 [Trichinella britovi]|uniref:Uncharacterized protein n=1 Tax=Trichinella britovi TaxID=45882 RepID=A0A0V1CSW0_TRIBR|nr:hypothetical protein T03_2325 [Trichinella britovi]KRZ94294.1 hypothetical protein T08_14555 [Trichinella sp. T8]
MNGCKLDKKSPMNADNGLTPGSGDASQRRPLRSAALQESAVDVYGRLIVPCWQIILILCSLVEI